MVPANGLDIVHPDAPTVGVHVPEVVLRLGYALLGGPSIPANGLDFIHWDTPTGDVRDAEVKLRVGVALLGS